MDYPLIFKRGLLMFIAASCAAMLIWGASGNVKAQERACTYSLESTAAMLAMSGNFNVVLDPPDRDLFVRDLESAIGFHLRDVTNVLIAEYGGVLVYGLEMKGCLSSPIPLPGQEPVRRPVRGIPA